MKDNKKVNLTLFFNIAVIIISVSLITYFCVSENGLIDLLKSDVKISAFWIAMAVACQLGNMFIDSIVTWLFIRRECSWFTLFDGIKSCFVGSFFSAITPSSTGGQPMQVLFLSKKNVDPGYATSCFMQKFLVYQITSTFFSILALALRFDFFVSVIETPILWAFVVAGFFSQVVVTTGFIIVSFNRRLSAWVIKVADKLMSKLKFIKNREKYVGTLKEQVDMFHSGNKALFKQPKLMCVSYIMIFVQVIFILLVPYCIYRGLSMNSASPIDMVCSQAFVNLASAMIPLPGATGGAELSFSVFYNMFFGVVMLKSALLIWRVITYYGVILISAPFSMLTKKKDDNTNNIEN